MNNEQNVTKPGAAANLMKLMSFTADKVLELADSNSVLGEKIEIEGMTIIPVSKISAGFAGGGANIVNVAAQKSNTPSGSGAKVTVTPLSFLVISNGEARVIDINAPANAPKKNLIASIIDAVKGMKKDKKAKTEDKEIIEKIETTETAVTEETK